MCFTEELCCYSFRAQTTTTDRRRHRFMTGIIRYFTLSPLPVSDRPEKKVVKLPLTPTGSGSLIRRREQNGSNDNSASQLLFQVQITVS